MKLPGKKRIIYDGKIPGVIYLTSQKKKEGGDLLQRMDRAFDRLVSEAGEKLLEDLKEKVTPAGTPGSAKQKDEEIQLSKIKFDYSTAAGGGDIFKRSISKIGSAFSTAAAARRAYKLAGGNPKELRRRYFFDRALASEFGGDFIRRTRGTFSSAPDATQDPGLSRQERFAAVVNRDLAARPQMMKQGEILDVDKYTDKTPLQSILDLAKKTADKINGLESGFVRIEKSNKETSAAFTKIKENLTEVKNVFVKTSDNFKQFVDNKEQVIKIKDQIVKFTGKQSAEISRDQKEQQLEMFNDTAGVTDVIEADQGLNREDSGGGSILDLIGDGLDFVEGRDIGRDRNRIRGSRRRLFRRRMSGLGRSIGGRLGGVGEGIGRVATGIGKNIGKAKSGIGKGIGKVGAKIGSKLGGVLLKKIPGVGLILGGLASIDRFKSGDIVGGLGEIGSGIASIFPGIGTAISLGIDAALIAKDVNEESKKPPTKLSGGGIIAGEAGNEMVMPLTAAPAKKAINNLKENSSGSLVGSIGPVVSAAAGIVRNPLYRPILGPVVNPIIQPILAQYKIPVYSADFGIFKSSKIKSAATKAQGTRKSLERAQDNPLTAAMGWIGNLFGGIGSGIMGGIRSVGDFFRNLFNGNRNRGNPGTLPPGETDPNIASMTTLTGIHKQAADIVAGYESSSSGGYNAMNRGTGGDSPEGSRHWLGKNLTEMTIGEIMGFQSRGRSTLNAAGRYQFVGNTLPTAARLAGLTTSDKFNPLNQDKMFVALLRSQGHWPWTARGWSMGKYTREQMRILDEAVRTPVQAQTAPPRPQGGNPRGGRPTPTPRSSQEIQENYGFQIDKGDASKLPFMFDGESYHGYKTEKGWDIYKNGLGGGRMDTSNGRNSGLTRALMDAGERRLQQQQRQQNPSGDPNKVGYAKIDDFEYWYQNGKYYQRVNGATTEISEDSYASIRSNHAEQFGLPRGVDPNTHPLPSGRTRNEDHFRSRREVSSLLEMPLDKTEIGRNGAATTAFNAGVIAGMNQSQNQQQMAAGPVVIIQKDSKTLKNAYFMALG